MSHEPFSGEPLAVELQEKAKAAQMALSVAYKRVFGTPAGKLVLDDLKARFGFGNWPASDTEDERKIARRVFMQGPLYHIEKQINFTDRPKRKAKSQTDETPQQDN